MRLAVFPPPGGGLGTLAASGQLSRLVDYYLPAYAQAFDSIVYLSYLDEDVGRHPAYHFPENFCLVPNRRSVPHRRYALSLVSEHATVLSECAVSRVLQAPGIIPAWRAKRAWGIPIAVTYGYRYAQFARAERRHLAWARNLSLEWLALRVADAIIVTTDELVRHVTRRVAPERVHLIPNGVDVDRFAPSVHSDRDPVPTVLFVGRLTRQKNLFNLLEAAAIAQRHVRFRVQFAGDGLLRDALLDHATELGVEVSFLGTVPHEDLPRVYQSADAFVLPSLIEGHPKVLLEAMSCALACVVSDCDGNRTLVKHGRTGLVADALSVAQLAENLQRVLVDRPLAEALGSAAREHVRARFDIRDCLATELRLLCALAQGRRG